MMENIKFIKKNSKSIYFFFLYIIIIEVIHLKLALLKCKKIILKEKLNWRILNQHRREFW